ncbi:MAG: type II toxin-antitoxin system VapC family toxin [Cyanobacteria bacterium J06555_13]
MEAFDMIVLDTHIWLWYVNKNLNKLPNGWTSEIEQAEKVAVATISCYEVALANKKGRLALPSDKPAWFNKATKAAGIELLPITPDIAYRAVNLSQIHKRSL